MTRLKIYGGVLDTIKFLGNTLEGCDGRKSKKVQCVSVERGNTKSMVHGRTNEFFQNTETGVRGVAAGNLKYEKRS